ncbi:MAG: phage tail sheath subtilisin-like domain-containing protein [Thermoanaerobaculia bacterium]
MAELGVTQARIDEQSVAQRVLEGVPTSFACAAGVTEKGPEDGVPVLVESLAQFEETFGGPLPEPGPDAVEAWGLWEGGRWWLLHHAVRGFFDNGGDRLWVSRVRPTGGDSGTLETLTPEDFLGSADGARGGVLALGAVDDGSICFVPGLWAPTVQEALVELCERRGDRFAVLDAPAGASPQEVLDQRGELESRLPAATLAALYYPWLEVADPADASSRLVVPPSGHVAGVLARVDRERGVWEAPANEAVRGAVSLERRLTDGEVEALAPRGINPLREMADRGVRIWGARTLAAASPWRYVGVRRYLTYLEQSLGRGTEWAVAEPNDDRLWHHVESVAESFLMQEWLRGALQGTRPEEAFFVRCDQTTMTREDIDSGLLICQVGVAPLRPAEFVTFRFAHRVRRP